MRSTAYKLKIKDLVGGKYVPPSEEAPGHLVTPWGEKVLRAHLIATIVDKFVRDDEGYAAMWLDDGSATIRAKAWGEDVRRMTRFEVGDLVEVVGRVREYDGEVHVVPEVIRRVEDPNWELVRELEILYARKKLLAEGRLLRPEPRSGIQSAEPPEREQAVGEVEELEELPLPEVPEELKKKALLSVEKLEGEEGASVTDVAADLDISRKEAEDALYMLLIEGQIYEPKAGRFKRLR